MNERRSLVKALIDALELREKLVTDGTKPVEADHIVGQGLKAEWGEGKQALFRCPKCRDTGWVMKLADFSRMYGPTWGPTQVATKCDAFCAFLAHERQQRQEAMGTAGDDPLVSAGRTRRRA